MSENLVKLLSDQRYALDRSAIVAATDAKGLITYVNDKFCEISGYSREELIGKTHQIICSGYHPKSFFANMWQTIASGEVWQGEVCNRKKNGSFYWVNTTITPFLDDQGRPEQYLSIRHEITDLKNAQQTILQQHEKLAASARLSAIGEMAATITHEINNPLAVILGRVEMLKSMLKDETLNREDMLRVADAIEVTGQRIAKIVRSMKSMASHQDSEPTQANSVQTLVNDALELCYHRFRNKGIALKNNKLEKDLIADCRGHEIVQVLVNLLNNSYDAIANLPEKWVQIDATDRGSMIEISIMDCGTGISKEVQAKMFNPFYSTKAVQYGTGIGLSISQSILKQNGGSLEYDTQSPHTRFILLIPKREKLKIA